MKMLISILTICASCFGALAGEYYAVGASAAFDLNGRGDVALPSGAVVHAGGTLAASETWAAGSVHVVYGMVVVPSNTVLTVASGSTVKFVAGGIIAEGTCIANGATFTDIADGSGLAMPSYTLRGNFEADAATRVKYAKNGDEFEAEGASAAFDLNGRGDVALPSGAVVHAGGMLAASETWAAGSVHVVYGMVVVPSNTVLTVENGATVKFVAGGIIAEGTCIANGATFTDIADGSGLAMPSYTLRGNFETDDATRVKYAKNGDEFAQMGDSGTFRLDITEDGYRFAHEKEEIAYSSSWGGGDGARVSVTSPQGDTVALVDEPGTASGVVEWNAPAAPGLYRFTHSSGGETLEAGFIVLDGAVVHGGTLEADETWTKDAVHIIGGNVYVPAGVVLTIESGAAVKFADGKILSMSGGGVCVAEGVVFTSIADDSAGGDTLADGGATEPRENSYMILGMVADDAKTEYRYGTVALCGAIGMDTVWRKEKTYVIDGTLTVASGTTLTIPTGTVVKFTNGSSLALDDGGECIAKGAIFTHIADDAVGGDTMGDGDATAPEYGKYTVDAKVSEDDATEYRYYVPATLSSSISTDTILRGNRVYVASNDVTVASGVTLTIGPGAILKFNAGCSLTVNGTLDAQGTRSAPIVLTSIKDDECGGDTNGDGNATYAQPGDWGRIYAGGTLNMNHCTIRHCNNNSDKGAIQGTGGTVTFDNGIIESSVYECVRMNSGRFTAHNSIFRDASMGFGYYGGSGVYIYNCIVADCTIACRASNKHFFNTVFYRCQTFLESTSSSCEHCVFFNPVGYGAQSASQVGGMGNIWGDPLFLDTENGDFRIAANSPCVDAGDGRVAPETDYWGCPRMDVHRVKDSGSPDADGACPDIGIYEVDGHAAVPPADLAVLRVAVPGGGRSAYAPGDTLAVSYVVTNLGATVNTTWRDTVAFSNAYGAVVHGAVVETTAALPTNGPAVMLERSVVVPPLAEGEWHVLVNANAYRDVFEQSDGDNNCGSSVETIAVAIPACTLSGTASGTVAKNAPLVRKYTAPEGRPYALRVAAPAGATVAYGVGVLPSGGAQSTAIVGADGYAYVSIPAGATVYVEVASERQGNVEIASFEAGLAVHSVSPAMLPQSGDATLTVAGLHFGPDAEVSLSDGRMSIVAESVSVESAERLTARFDCARLAAGAAYALSVKSGSADASLANAVTVSGEKGEARLYAKLDMPSSLRAGRSFVFYIDYANTGNVDMPAPVFTVKSDEMIFTTDYGVYTNSVRVIGLGAKGSAGVLKPGKSFRMPVKAQVKATATGGVSYRLFSAWVGASDSGDELELDQFFSDDYVFWHGEEDQDEFDAIAEKMGATWGDFYRNLGDYVTHLDEYCLATFDYEQMSQSFAWHCVSEVKESTRKWEESETAGTVDANSRVRASNTRFAALRRNASGEETLWTLSELYKDWAIPVDSSQLRARTDRHNALLAMDNSYPGDVWIFNGGSSWENPVWHRLIQTNGNLRVVSSVWNADDDVYVLCHGNLHSVHSKWIFDMAYALKKRDPNCNVLAVDWGDESTAEMTIAQTARAAVILGAAGVEVGGLGGLFLGATIGIGSVFLGIRYPECAFATALDIYEVSQTAVAQLEKAGVSPGKTTVIGHSHGGHVAGNIARSLSSRGGKTKRLVGMETSSFTSHMLVPQGCRFPDSWDGRAADVSEFYKTSYWMSMGSTSFDGAKQVWGDYNFLLVGIYDSSRREFVRDHFEHQWLLGAGKSENWTLEYIKNCDANNNEGRMGAKRHDTVEEWFIDTINDEEKWKNLGFNWKGDKNSSDSAEYFGMPKSLAKEYPNRYHGVINIKDQRLELARPENATEGWRYKEQVLEGLGGQFDTSPALDILQDNITQSIEYRILPEKFPDTIDEGNCTISFAITNAANNLSINYDDVDKWFSRNEAWGPWWKDICTGVWLCRPFEENDTGIPDESKRAIDDLRWMKIQRIKQLKIEKLSDFVRPEMHDGEKYKDLALDIPEKFFNHPISSDGEEFLLVAGAGVSSKGGEHELAYDYAGDLCQSNNWFVKKVRVKPTMLKMSVNGDLLQDDDWKEIVIGKTQTTVELSLEAVADKDSNIEYSWFRSDTGTSFEGKKTAITISVSPWEKSKLVDLTVFSMKNGKVVRSTHVTVRIIRKGGGGGGDGNGGGSSPVPTSYDPNEMAGPDGVGEKRFVQPGDWMTYTIFFENKTNATASAQFVTVVNSLGEWLDWSTFEMGDVGFGTQVDTGLTGSQNGTSDATMEGTNLVVRTEVSLDAENGIASWFLRIVSPYGDSDGWPYADDPTGFLPPNDSTHRGEGHLTYRIKVREDAPANVVITNSASIVFDYNDPIETDPAWWNTVAPEGGRFVAAEVATDEGGTATVKVYGGSANSASSVKVYLTYNTAATADLDLKAAAIDGVTPKGGLKFPLTLNWAAGEICEKTITIPIKADKTVEDDEFFTLQLAEAEGMEVGEAGVCTVTIRDMNDKTLKAVVTAYKPKKGETVATNSVAVAGTAGGFVAGTGAYTSGSKLTLTAEPRPGWTFAGWTHKNGDGSILSTKAKWQIVVTNDVEYAAVFEKIPYVRGLADPADGGKVSGSGYCTFGKKVTLKATANKNFAFLGWAAVDSGREPSTAIEYIATTPSLVIDRTAKPAANSKTSTTITEVNGDTTYYAVFKSHPAVSVSVEATDGTGANPTGKGAGRYAAGTITGEGKYEPGKKATLKATANKGYVFAGWEGDIAADGSDRLKSSISFAMPSNDVAYVARFATAEEDASSIALSVDGDTLSSAPASTNIWAGVYIEWPVAASALSETKIQVSGLPSGLKFTAKPVTARISAGKNAVTVTNVPANTIYGAPSAASRAGRDGKIVPSAVKFTVTTAGKSSQTYRIDVTVDARPAWAVGTFDGATDAGGLVQSFAVAANGKISGKIADPAGTWTLNAPSFDSYDVENEAFIATVTGKKGNAAFTNEVKVSAEISGEAVRGVAAGDGWTAWQNLWSSEPWKTLAKPFAKAKPLAIEADGAAITLKFASNGTATATGRFVAGVDSRGKDIVYSASCKAALIPESGDGTKYRLFVHFPPNAGKFDGYAAEIKLEWDGAAFSAPE